jgi:hypothetical protein
MSIEAGILLRQNGASRAILVSTAVALVQPPLPFLRRPYPLSLISLPHSLAYSYSCAPSLLHTNEFVCRAARSTVPRSCSRARVRLPPAAPQSILVITGHACWALVIRTSIQVIRIEYAAHSHGSYTFAGPLLPITSMATSRKRLLRTSVRSSPALAWRARSVRSSERHRLSRPHFSLVSPRLHPPLTPPCTHRLIAKSLPPARICFRFLAALAVGWDEQESVWLRLCLLDRPLTGWPPLPSTCWSEIDCRSSFSESVRVLFC